MKQEIKMTPKAEANFQNTNASLSIKSKMLTTMPRTETIKAKKRDILLGLFRPFDVQIYNLHPLRF